MPVVRELVTLFRAKTDKKGFKEADRMLGGIKRLAGAAAAAFTAHELFRGFQNMIEVASDATERLNVLDVGFGENRQAVQDWAAQVADSVGRSRADVEDFVGISQAMLSAMLGNADAAEAMSKEVTKLSIDLGSFFNIADKDAFVALRAGLSGETEPLKRFGIVMTQAALEAFSLSEGTGKLIKDMTEAEKTTLRFNFIMAKTTKIQGDAARTSGALANVQKALAGTITNIQEDLGKFFLPAITKLKKGMLDTARAVQRWIQENQKLLRQRIHKAMEFLLQLSGKIATTFKSLAQLAGQLWDRIAQGVKSIDGLSTALKAIGFVAAVAFAPVTAAIVGIFLLVDDLSAFFNPKDKRRSLTGMLVDGFNRLADKIDFFGVLKKTAGGAFKDIARIFTKQVETLGRTWARFRDGDFIGGFGSMLKGTMDFVEQMAALFVKNIFRINDLFVELGVLIASVFDADVDSGEVFDRIKGQFMDIFGGIGDAFIEELGTNTPQSLQRIMDQLRETRDRSLMEERAITLTAFARQAAAGAGGQANQIQIHLDQSLAGTVDPETVTRATQRGIFEGLRRSGLELPMQAFAPSVRN